MIPQRRQDLVPEIRAPRHGGTATQQVQRSKATVTLERHPLQLTSDELSAMRLLSFIAAPDCDRAPAKLLVVPSAECTDGASNAPDASTTERAVEEAMSGDEAPVAAPRRAEQRRTRAARRVHYTTHPQRGDPERGDRVVRLTSIPIVEYEHLDCLLLIPPAGPAVGNDAQAGNATDASYDVALLPCPLLELRCDRAEPARVAGASISANWLPERSTRFNKRDWRSMDVLDVAEAKRGRWEADEAESAAGEEGNDRAKTSVTRSRKPRNQVELQNYNPVMPSARVQRGDMACTPASVASHVTVIAAAPASPTTATQSTGNAPAAPSIDEERMPASSSAPRQRVQAPSVAASPVTLDDCATTVLRELHHAGRPTAPIKELEKLILKRLPSYAGMAAKTKAEDTKAEAIQWLREAQAGLRRWLLEHGHTIDPSGNVFFVIEG